MHRMHANYDSCIGCPLLIVEHAYTAVINKRDSINSSYLLESTTKSHRKSHYDVLLIASVHSSVDTKLSSRRA